MQTFHLKKDNMTGHKKKEIVNMAQENLYMFKRLKEKTSCYDFCKFDKEYNQAQYYKRSHCTLLPSIDFNKSKRTISLGSKSRIIHRPFFKINNSTSYNNININTNNSYNINKTNIIVNDFSKEQNLFNKNLYKKKLEEFKYEDFVDIKNKTKNETNDNETKEEKKCIKGENNKDKKINDMNSSKKKNKEKNENEERHMEFNKEKNGVKKMKENEKGEKIDIVNDKEENRLEKINKQEDNKNQFENKENNEVKKKI